VTPSEFCEDLDTHKTRMNGLSCGEESMTIYSAVLIQYKCVTDGRMDIQPIAKTCFSIADARKKNDMSTKLPVCDCTVEALPLKLLDSTFNMWMKRSTITGAAFTVGQLSI